MEDTLGVPVREGWFSVYWVLILVLMEDTLGAGVLIWDTVFPPKS